MAHLHARTLFAGPFAALRDVRCSAPRSGCGAEEASEGAAWVLPRRGLFQWHSGGEAVLADPGSALLLAPGEVHRVSHPAEGGDDCTVLNLAPAIFEEVADTGVACRHRLLPAATQLRHMALHGALNRGSAEPLAAEEAALDLAASLAADLGIARPAGRRHRPAAERLRRRQVERTRSLLALSIDRALALDELAAAVNSSPFHLARCFRAATGETLRGYRTRLRLAIALERLAGGADNLTGLALDLGFAHHSHLTASFRRRFGVTPAAARRQLTRGRLAELRKFLTAGTAADR
jgi:AraC family transcriptional regulator